MSTDLNLKGLIDRSALLIIDMQNDFLTPGAPYECKEVDTLVRNISSLKDKLASRDVPVIYTREVHRADGVDRGREADREPLHCIEGTPGMEIVEELTPSGGDYVIDKRRFSCFFQTDLLGLLKGLKTELILVTGITANCCVLSTVIDAYQYDFRTITIQDCVSSNYGLLNAENFRDLLDLFRFYSNPMFLKEFLSHLEDGRHD